MRVELSSVLTTLPQAWKDRRGAQASERILRPVSSQVFTGDKERLLQVIDSLKSQSLIQDWITNQQAFVRELVSGRQETQWQMIESQFTEGAVVMLTQHEVVEKFQRELVAGTIAEDSYLAALVFVYAIEFGETLRECLGLGMTQLNAAKIARNLAIYHTPEKLHELRTLGADRFSDTFLTEAIVENPRNPEDRIVRAIALANEHGIPDTTAGLLVQASATSPESLLVEREQNVARLLQEFSGILPEHAIRIACRTHRTYEGAKAKLTEYHGQRLALMREFAIDGKPLTEETYIHAFFRIKDYKKVLADALNNAPMVASEYASREIELPLRLIAQYLVLYPRQYKKYLDRYVDDRLNQGGRKTFRELFIAQIDDLLSQSAPSFSELSSQVRERTQGLGLGEKQYPYIFKTAVDYLLLTGRVIEEGGVLKFPKEDHFNLPIYARIVSLVAKHKSLLTSRDLVDLLEKESPPKKRIYYCIQELTAAGILVRMENNKLMVSTGRIAIAGEAETDVIEVAERVRRRARRNVNSSPNS